MERLISITMNDKFDIIVSTDGVEKLTIQKENREINAQDLYDSLEFDYDSVKSYKLKTIQEQGSISDAEYRVLSNFYNLLKGIVEEINNILSPKEEEKNVE